jgi:cell division septation protein DedD
MLKMIPLTFALLASACSHAPPPATVAPGSAVTTSVAGPEIPTVAGASGALAADCTVVRALDGRAVCAEQLPGGAARLATETPPVAAPVPMALTLRDAAAEQRDYVVIGSFGTHENAARWAEYNAAFAPEIRRVDGPQGRMYRVLVGPLGEKSAPLMRDILGAVGITGSWPLATHCTSCDGTALPERKLAEVAPRR